MHELMSEVVLLLIAIDLIAHDDDPMLLVLVCLSLEVALPLEK